MNEKREHWWQMLMAVPASKNSFEYQRLKRVWFDHTWNNSPFFDPTHENHLTVTFFENFAILPFEKWIPLLVTTAGIDAPPFTVSESNWAYEVVVKPMKKMADVVIHARTSRGDLVLVIEAKRPGGKLKKTDDPTTYLDQAEFSWCEDRHLIYLVDEDDALPIRNSIDSKRAGIITWQQLGGMQIQVSLDLPLPEEIKGFLAGAIQYQYSAHGITPTRLTHDYLHGEPRRSSINKENPDRMKIFEIDWRLPTPSAL